MEEKFSIEDFSSQETVLSGRHFVEEKFSIEDFS